MIELTLIRPLISHQGLLSAAQQNHPHQPHLLLIRSFPMQARRVIDLLIESRTLLRQFDAIRRIYLRFIALDRSSATRRHLQLFVVLWSYQRRNNSTGYHLHSKQMSWSHQKAVIMTRKTMVLRLLHRLRHPRRHRNQSQLHRRIGRTLGPAHTEGILHGKLSR